jgi:ATP-binding cassette subfamily C protein
VGVFALLLAAARSLFSVPLGDLLILVLAYVRLIGLVPGAQQAWQGAVQVLPSFTAVQDLRQRCERAREDDASDVSGTPLVLQHEVGLRCLTFAYPGSDGRVLNALDITLRAGRITALIGPSGAGKSTLADLLLGLLTPETGQILVDGAPLTPAQRAAWRRVTAYVPQDAFLFHDTIRANLLWAAPGASEEELRRALRLADAWEFVSRQPAGLDTIVGERGIRFSGGERTRLALARALVRRPELLVLDEATAHLDPESEQRVLDTIEALRGETTVLLITHHEAVSRRADAVYRLQPAGRAEVERIGALEVATDR